MKRPLIIFNGQVLRHFRTAVVSCKVHLSEYVDNGVVHHLPTGCYNYVVELNNYDGGITLVRCHNYGDDRESGQLVLGERKSGRSVVNIVGGWLYEYPGWVVAERA